MLLPVILLPVTLLPLLLACATEPSSTDSGAGPDGGADTGPAIDTSPHEVLVPPYLQRLDPQTMRVLWETRDGHESVVEYGLTDALGTTATGGFDDNTLGVLHVVELPDLLPDTRYWYRVRTGGTQSEVLSFRTPPAPGSPVQLVAVSDMQRDDSHPDKWAEVVAQGIVPYATQTWAEDLPDALGGVLLAGDLVDNGWLYTDWQDDFFAGAAPLMGQVPLMPVPGNHEGNSPLFWRYFELPENGSPGYEEHWWWLDHGSVRIVGLDSNGGYKDELQLDWLDTVLADTCSDPDIDVVLAQLHHPFESELWPSGEEEWTGSVVGLLEAFSAACGKPSVHLFGHTHGYSRGQSRDHRHLWINVGTGGGALDRWGSSSQVDYPQFSRSEDEYGFVALEVTDQALTVRRLAMGTPEAPREATETDSITVPLVQTPPDAPSLEVEGSGGLRGSTFAHPQGGAHGSSHWQLAASCDGFASPLAEHWVQHEDWFQGVDLLAGVDLTVLDLDQLDADAVAAAGCARVRYRDRGLAWSEWSAGLPL